MCTSVLRVANFVDVCTQTKHVRSSDISFDMSGDNEDSALSSD